MQRSPIPARASRTQDYDLLSDIEEEDAYYPTRPPSSARRYQDTQGNQVIQRDKQRIVIHEGPPPKQRGHWTVTLAIGMALMLGLYFGLTWVAAWWINHQLDTTYGMPRTYQVDAVVGHNNDSPANPRHFIFLNLNGKVEIIELPAGDGAKAKIYLGPVLFSDNAASIPVTGEFQTVNGTVEMLVHIQDKILLYISDGTQFKLKQ